MPGIRAVTERCGGTGGVGWEGGAFWHLLALEKWHKAYRSDPTAEILLRVRRACTVGLCQALSSTG